MIPVSEDSHVFTKKGSIRKTPQALLKAFQ